jgi:predicted dehydrogenase
MPNTVSRRTFFAGAATAAGALSVAGANERVRLGLIGSGGRGQHLVHMAQQAGGAEFVAICDAWDQRMNDATKVIGSPVQQYKTYQALLERKDIDAVIVATTDHHHSHVSVDACRAGKDVYVEKPMTSLPMQGHGMVKAVKENNRILQVGVQQRSIEPFLSAKKAYVDTGRLGKVHMVRTVWNANGGYLEKPPAGMENKPAGLDWDMWVGWLPKMPWDPKRYFNRFSYWDISTGGQTGGLFVHMIDVVHWYLGVNRPLSAVAMGGIYQYPDGRDTPWGGAPAPRGLSRARSGQTCGAWRPHAALESRPTRSSWAECLRRPVSRRQPRRTTPSSSRRARLRVLILSGRNNHDWRASTPHLRRILDATGRFDVRVTEEPSGLTAESLRPYDVLVSDYCGPRWGETAEKAVAAFVQSGKGLVVCTRRAIPSVTRRCWAVTRRRRACARRHGPSGQRWSAQPGARRSQRRATPNATFTR